MQDVSTPTQLWNLRRGRDAAQCIVAAHPLGVELRYVMNRHPLISRVFSTWDEVAEQAGVWRLGLEARGWMLPARPSRRTTALSAAQ